LDALVEGRTAMKMPKWGPFYLRNGKTICKGLDEQYYKTQLEKTIMKLKGETTAFRKMRNSSRDSDFDGWHSKLLNSSS
jgi:hypothetical protein